MLPQHYITSAFLPWEYANRKRTKRYLSLGLSFLDLFEHFSSL